MALTSSIGPAPHSAHQDRSKTQLRQVVQPSASMPSGARRGCQRQCFSSSTLIPEAPQRTMPRFVRNQSLHKALANVWARGWYPNYSLG